MLPRWVDGVENNVGRIRALPPDVELAVGVGQAAKALSLQVLSKHTHINTQMIKPTSTTERKARVIKQPALASLCVCLTIDTRRIIHTAAAASSTAFWSAQAR